MNLYVQNMESAKNLACQAVDQILTVMEAITFVLVIQAMLENPILKAAKVYRDNFIEICLVLKARVSHFMLL